jgi:hypothetical protein
MLTIKRVYNKFRVKASAPGSGERGWHIDVANLVEVNACIAHYFGQTFHGVRGNECPLCKQATEEFAKRKKKG